MLSNIAKTAIAAAAFAALPGAAQAGTTTTTANVTMQVASQCTLSGATVYLGAFKTTDTWGAVGAKHGNISGPTFTAGTVGGQSLKFGTVTCDAGLPWALTIKGTGNGTALGSIMITLNGKFSIMYPAIKRVGTVTVNDSNSSWTGTGQQVWNSPLYSTGTGAAQDLMGNVTVSLFGAGATAYATTVLGAAGTGSDTLSYVLTF